AYVASVAAAIPNMQQIASSTGHPMSQALADYDSDHPVMKALRTHRDWLIQQLGDSPDNPHRRDDLGNGQPQVLHEAPEAPIRLTQRSPAQQLVRGSETPRTRYVSTARAARTRRHGSRHSHAHPTSQGRPRLSAR